ncbi:MAG: hypothetical protein ACPGUD_10770 [Parashewanella sp.]
MAVNLSISFNALTPFSSFKEIYSRSRDIYPVKANVQSPSQLEKTIKLTGSAEERVQLLYDQFNNHRYESFSVETTDKHLFRINPEANSFGGIREYLSPLLSMEVEGHRVPIKAGLFLLDRYFHTREISDFQKCIMVLRQLYLRSTLD